LGEDIFKLIWSETNNQCSSFL